MKTGSDQQTAVPKWNGGFFVHGSAAVPALLIGVLILGLGVLGLVLLAVLVLGILSLVLLVHGLILPMCFAAKP